MLDILDCSMQDLIEPVATPTSKAKRTAKAAGGGELGALRPRPARIVVRDSR